MSEKDKEVLNSSEPDWELSSTFVFQQIDSLKGYLEGRILTIVDASVSDSQQRKAMKDLVREAIWSKEGFSKTIANMADGKPPYADNYEPILDQDIRR